MNGVMWENLGKVKDESCSIYISLHWSFRTFTTTLMDLHHQSNNTKNWAGWKSKMSKSRVTKKNPKKIHEVKALTERVAKIKYLIC